MCAVFDGLGPCSLSHWMSYSVIGDTAFMFRRMETLVLVKYLEQGSASHEKGFCCVQDKTH